MHVEDGIQTFTSSLLSPRRKIRMMAPQAKAQSASLELCHTCGTHEISGYHGCSLLGGVPA
jgi:hypothetical protein